MLSGRTPSEVVGRGFLWQDHPVPFSSTPSCPWILCLYSYLLFFFSSLFSLLLFYSLSLLAESASHFVPMSINCSWGWCGRYRLDRTDPLARSRQLARRTHCCRSSNTQCCSWTCTAAKQFKDQQCWKLCNAKTELTECSAMQYQVTVAGAGKKRIPS